MKPRILVTGAAGKTGAAVAGQLIEIGDPVNAFVVDEATSPCESINDRTRCLVHYG